MCRHLSLIMSVDMLKRTNKRITFPERVKLYIMKRGKQGIHSLLTKKPGKQSKPGLDTITHINFH